MAYMRDKSGRRLDSYNPADVAGVTNKLRPIAQATHLPVRATAPNNISDGVSTGITTRKAHNADVAATGVRLAFANYYDNNGVDADGPNAITVKCYVKTGDGFYWPVFFRGALSVTIAPGATVVSDPIGLTLARGETFFTQTYVSVASGEKYPLGVITNNTTSTEGVVAGDSAAGNVATSATRGYAPWAILGVPVAHLTSPSILVAGDSRVVGYGDSDGTADARGWARRSLGGKLSYLNVAVSGSTSQVSAQVGAWQRRLRLADPCQFDAAIVVYGVNDLSAGRTAAQVQGYLTPIWQMLVARGLKVYAATIAPVSSSTDNWQTLANQTPAAWNAERVALNAWLRTVPAPLSGVFEFADAVESARDSGKWKATGVSFGFTADGTHESPGGYIAEAAALDPNVLGALLP